VLHNILSKFADLKSDLHVTKDRVVSAHLTFINRSLDLGLTPKLPKYRTKIANYPSTYLSKPTRKLFFFYKTFFFKSLLYFAALLLAEDLQRTFSPGRLAASRTRLTVQLRTCLMMKSCGTSLALRMVRFHDVSQRMTCSAPLLIATHRGGSLRSRDRRR
jgi:hypothetical protein